MSETPFQQRFNRFMRDNRLNALSAAKRCAFRPRPATLRLWRDGMIPQVETLERFLTFFPTEDVEEWLQDLARTREAAQRAV